MGEGTGGLWPLWAKVRGLPLASDYYATTKHDWIGEVVSNIGEEEAVVRSLDGSSANYTVEKKYFEVISKGEQEMAINTDEQDLATQIRNLALSDDDRLLRENGVILSDGLLSSDGQAIVMNAMFQQLKASIVADLKTLEANETEDETK